MKYYILYNNKKQIDFKNSVILTMDLSKSEVNIYEKLIFIIFYYINIGKFIL